jgi:hypothetical protein
MKGSKCAIELGLGAPLRQLDQFEERRPAGGDEIADLVEQVAVVVPTTRG